MAAPKGNKFWEARSSHGRKPKFETSESLWEACCEYFQWVEDNPLWESKVAQYQGQPVDMIVPKMRAMTVAGLCLFLDISEETWSNYKQRGDDFIEVTTRATKVIYDQKFAGAAAELFNPNIIARDLGLSEKTNSDLNVNVRKSLKDFYEEADS